MICQKPKRGFRIIAAVFPVTPIVQTSVKTILASRGICCFRLIALVARALGKSWIRVLQSRQKQIQMTAINFGFGIPDSKFWILDSGFPDFPYAALSQPKRKYVLYHHLTKENDNYYVLYTRTFS